MDRLEVREFAHIRHADIEFGDLTVLVGPQAAGKSLLLQLWKLALDWDEIRGALNALGHDIRNRRDLLDAFLGEGMGTAWRHGTRIRVNDEPFDPQIRLREVVASQRSGKVFFVPAHRAMLVSTGWALPMTHLGNEVPFVARLFSHSLYERFSGKPAGPLFPVPRRLKEDVRRLIDAAVYHGGHVQLRPGGQRRLELRHGDSTLPFMTWTAGQREFTPLLLGLYDVLPPRRQTKNPDIDWIVIEEPEMGLHPQAVTAIMALVLELLWRGYKVVLSTHAPIVLDVVFAMRLLANRARGAELLQHAFGLRSSTRPMIREALRRSTRTYALQFDDQGKTFSTDISELDPGAEDETIAGWGGLTTFSGRFGEAIANAVAGDEA